MFAPPHGMYMSCLLPWSFMFAISITLVESCLGLLNARACEVGLKVSMRTEESTQARGPLLQA